jgi:hypothetical protein
MMETPQTERRERTLDNPYVLNSEDASGAMTPRQLKNKFASSTRLIKKSTQGGIKTYDSNGSIEFEGGVPKFGSTVSIFNLLKLLLVHIITIRVRQ